MLTRGATDWLREHSPPFTRPSTPSKSSALEHPLGTDAVPHAASCDTPTHRSVLEAHHCAHPPRSFVEATRPHVWLYGLCATMDSEDGQVFVKARTSRAYLYIHHLTSVLCRTLPTLSARMNEPSRTRCSYSSATSMASSRLLLACPQPRLLSNCPTPSPDPFCRSPRPASSPPS